MSCEHRRIKSENCVISCLDCGAILPPEFLTAGNAPKRAEKPAADTGSRKSTRKTRMARKGE